MPQSTQYISPQTLCMCARYHRIASQLVDCWSTWCRTVIMTTAVCSGTTWRSSRCFWSYGEMDYKPLPSTCICYVVDRFIQDLGHAEHKNILMVTLYHRCFESLQGDLQSLLQPQYWCQVEQNWNSAAWSGSSQPSPSLRPLHCRRDQWAEVLHHICVTNVSQI